MGKRKDKFERPEGIGKDGSDQGQELTHGRRGGGLFFVVVG